ncbi:hypothetical protein ACLB2K_050495 [Fragaria x ananassa]
MEGAIWRDCCMGGGLSFEPRIAGYGGRRREVYGYRMSLWAEHLDGIEKTFEDPQSLECTKRVCEIAKQNWKHFIAEEHREMKGHLMQYPVQVGKDGKVSSIPGAESFPDVGGKILGAPTNLPDALTT